MGWRYIASRLNGDGTETFLDWDLPLSAVGITNTLSGPDAITATITPEVAALKVDGKPLIEPWSTAIYAEADGQVRAGCIVTDMNTDGPGLTLDCTGFPGYAYDMPYTGNYSKTGIEALDVLRDIWSHLQGELGGNIGLIVDPLVSGVKMGDATTPVKYAWYQTTNLGDEINTLAKATPFEYRESHVWAGEVLEHRLKLGYPVIGRRRLDLRFVVGENIQVVPPVDFGTGYASGVIVLGAGEGQKMIVGTSTRPEPRLRRVAIVTDKSLTSKTAADSAAAQQVLLRLGLTDVSEVTITDHPHAPLGSFDVGDEILVQVGTGWGEDVALWCRVTAMTIAPESVGVARLTLLRTDRITA